MKFTVHGEYKIPRYQGIVDREALDDFWLDVDADVPGLPYAIGCYVFGVKAGRGIRPWYVGRATSRVFRRECFAHHKLTHYNRVLAGRRGTPCLYLLSQITPKNRFVSHSSGERPAVKALEVMLIGAAYRANHELCNLSDTRMYRELEVPGFINTKRGQVTSSVRSFKSLMNLD